MPSMPSMRHAISTRATTQSPRLLRASHPDTMRDGRHTIHSSSRTNCRPPVYGTLCVPPPRARACQHVPSRAANCPRAGPRLHYRLLTLCPAARTAGPHRVSRPWCRRGRSTHQRRTRGTRNARRKLGSEQHTPSLRHINPACHINTGGLANPPPLPAPHTPATTGRAPATLPAPPQPPLPPPRPPPPPPRKRRWRRSRKLRGGMTRHVMAGCHLPCVVCFSLRCFVLAVNPKPCRPLQTPADPKP